MAAGMETEIWTATKSPAKINYRHFTEINSYNLLQTLANKN